MATSGQDRRAAGTGRTRPGGDPLGIVVRDGEAFFDGMSVALGQLERARRAGSTEDDLRGAFPGLPPGAFDAIDAFLRANPETPAAVTPAPRGGDADDDGEGFEEDLDALLDAHAELFRRLAR